MPKSGLAFAVLPACVCLFLVACDGTAGAAECLAAPNRAAPEGQHWFFRTDRDANRKCWYLREREAETTGSVPTAQNPPAGPSATSSLSQDDEKKLFEEFLRWRAERRETR